MEEQTHWLPKDEYGKMLVAQDKFHRALFKKLSKIQYDELVGMHTKEKVQYLTKNGIVGYDQVTLLKICVVLADEIDSLRQEITELKQQLNK